jgi:DNA polymerase-1
VENIESPTAVYLGIMKYNGVPIDAGYMAERQQEAEKEMARIREEIASIIGPDVNIGSNCSTNDFHLYGSISYLYLALIMPPFLQNRLLSLY